MPVEVIPLLARLQRETPDSVLEAAKNRLESAELLLANHQRDWAIYTAGYVAEMVMKVAYCRLDPTFPVNGSIKDAFGPAKAVWQSTLPGTNLPDNHRHDLLFWETVVDVQRGTVTSASMERLVVSRCLLTIRKQWKVDLRYQPVLATEDEAKEVCDAARLVYQNREAIWRK